MISNKQNICKFIPSAEIDTDINVLNFVYEANWHYADETVRTPFLLCIVTGGVGRYITPYGRYNLKMGDIFFIFSAKPFKLLNDDRLEFCYVSFIGARVHPLLDRLQVRFNMLYFSGYEHLVPFWKDAIERADSYNSDLVAHSVLYHTFSYIASDAYQRSLPDKASNLVAEVRRYVDNNYRDPQMSLTLISEKFGYSPQYLSDRFKHTMSITISDYVTARRMEYATAMMSEGNYSVKQISEACGYRDPLYFSKIFKKSFGIPPSANIKNNKNKTSD
ncbi:MAG: helix-turn-helix transcriptional regulator [Clostridia bacterium]|nr:helix-turn-helix transcriptional regulator [Clostridia bacterium]